MLRFIVMSYLKSLLAYFGRFAPMRLLIYVIAASSSPSEISSYIKKAWTIIVVAAYSVSLIVPARSIATSKVIFKALQRTAGIASFTYSGQPLKASLFGKV